MSFPFRRRERNQFKHIAHGLIPAATVAPRSAVPRTPPPRSPNPSPERPRSALAAAILMTSLTGRTVAIPQPRQRSYSENDSVYIDESAVIEPYATARDLGVEQNWKVYADRSVSTPVMSYDDEDTELQMSDLEREHAPQTSERILSSSSNEPVYAVPIKEKKKQATLVREAESAPCVPPIKDDDDEAPKMSNTDHQEESRVDSPLAYPAPLSDSETSRKSPKRKKTTKGAIESLNGGPAGVGTEEMEKLYANNQLLAERNIELANQLEEMKQKMKTMRVKIRNMKNERRGAAESLKSQYAEADAAELESLRHQAQELVDENDALKTMVHRLNVEMSRYQTKYRPLTKEETQKIVGLPQRGPPPPWLIDMKYLSPLLLAYEDRIDEKDNLIQSFEEEMNNTKARVQKVIEENEQLHQQLDQNRTVTPKEWDLMQTQTKLALEENQVLMEQLEVQRTKERDTQSQHIQEEAEKKSQADELLELQKQQDVLRSKYRELKANMEGMIEGEEHAATVKELKSQLQREREKNKAEVGDLMDKISALQARSKSLLLERNDLVADNKTLEAETEAVKKTNRKLQRKVGMLKTHLEDAMDKEVAAHQYLANLITLAETIAGERDELVHVARGLETEKHGALNQMVEGSIRLGKLEEMVKVYRRKTAGKLEGIVHKLTEQEEDYAGKTSQHRREMRHLQRLLQDRQEALDEVLQQKRQVEGELEVIWESTSHENKQLKEFLHKALKQSQLADGHGPRGFQATSVNEYSFSYCDVNSSTHGEEPLK
ncbi:centrosomal protein of 89 kDa isoform X2 [Spea bombifrons]|uniref:centrosomal protein of 89 kDa isoform X2 n=1 Tax=Spea bombifrons TaxID=233779 RepID=UPI00234AE495|nr:centrosomal protein of 89 kDa isoform X2 [Spea bombifrons]